MITPQKSTFETTLLSAARSIIGIGIVLVLVFGVQKIYASLAGPTAVAPGANKSVFLNIGPDTQRVDTNFHIGGSTPITGSAFSVRGGISNLVEGFLAQNTGNLPSAYINTNTYVGFNNPGVISTPSSLIIDNGPVSVSGDVKDDSLAHSTNTLEPVCADYQGILKPCPAGTPISLGSAVGNFNGGGLGNGQGNINYPPFQAALTTLNENCYQTQKRLTFTGGYPNTTKVVTVTSTGGQNPSPQTVPANVNFVNFTFAKEPMEAVTYTLTTVAQSAGYPITTRTTTTYVNSIANSSSSNAPCAL